MIHDKYLVHCKRSVCVWWPVVQSLSRVQLFATPQSAARQASLSITNSWSLLKLMSIASRWCHPTISSSVIPFSSCPQSFLTSASFLMSEFFASGGQSIGVSASFLAMNIQGWFPLELTGLISLLSKGLSRVFCSTTVRKHQFFGILYSPTLAFFIVQLSHPYMTTGKTKALNIWTLLANCFCFLICCLGFSRLFSQGASIF